MDRRGGEISSVLYRVQQECRENGSGSVPPWNDGRFGPFTLITIIGRGGIASVYAAHDAAGRIVAVKILEDGVSAGAAQRFQQEVAATKKLEHPNIIPAFDAGEIDGRPYISMKLLGASKYSGPLGGLEPSVFAGIMAKVARALQYCHERGFVACDFVSSDVLVDENGEPYLTGLWALRDAPETLRLDPGAMPRGWRHMAPEEALGPTDDPYARTVAVDIYRFGSALYDLLVGTPPIRIRTDRKNFRRHLRHFNPGLRRIVLKCLEEDPRQRYHSAAALAGDLERASRRQPGRTVAAVSLAAVVLLGLAVWLICHAAH
jgi:serine/threonine protein kinase